MRALLTWSDRGTATPPSHHGPRPRADRGPVMRLLESHRYGQAFVLTTPQGLPGAQALQGDMAGAVPKVRILPMAVSDPSDYGALFEALGGLLDPLSGALAGVSDLDVCLSAGTPQAQCLWVILVQAGLLKARMLQVIPPAFVPDPHPLPVREVRLDFEGFPEIRALKDEVRRLRAELGPREMIGESPAMVTLRRRIARVARSPAPVIVQGETGVGKELVAQAIHRQSPRDQGPFVAESCGALNEGTLASALFGHERGAFTGAVDRRRGLFEQASGGTLFLDEVGEMPPALQVSLLRVLQEGVLRRVGGEAPVRVDVRVVAATHRDLRALVEAGRFREDLYYRLAGATLEVPPLRARGGDLDGLIPHFLGELGHPHLRVSSAALDLLHAHPWPGNVRELRAEVTRWTIFCDREVGVGDLSREVRGANGSEDAPPRTSGDAGPLRAAVEAAEREAVARALRACEGNLSQAARLLEVDRNTLKARLSRWGWRGAPETWAGARAMP